MKPHALTRKSKVAAVLLSTALVLSGCAQGNQESSSGNKSTNGSAAPNASTIKDSVAGKQECGDAPCMSLSITGDFLLHDGLWDQAAADAKAATGSKTASEGIDFGPMIEAQKPYLAQADLSMCHLETPVAAPEGPYSGYPAFNAPPQILTAAKAAGYDACTTASNHTIDQGTAGLKRTYQALDKAGLGHTGSNLSKEESTTPDIFTSSNGVKVAVIAGTYALNGITPEQPWQVDMLEAEPMIAKARKARQGGADIVITNMHAGEEYASTPNAQQVQVAKKFADSGQFDLIYGEHTHSVLPIEKYKNTWIVYGLGNNLTELSPWYRVNNEGLMVNAIFTKSGDKWAVKTLQWAPSLMVQKPYRWCPIAQENPALTCAPAQLASQSRARTKEVVNALGAEREGLREWKITQ